MEAGKYYKYTYGQNIAKLPILKLGSRGDYVRLLQQSISDAGFNCGTVDGQFGKKTDGAIRAYQQACGLSRDGIVGPKTWDKVLAVDVVELDISQLKAALV